jgi:hypothetical protein
MSATRLSPSRRREDIRAWWAAHMKAQQDSGQSHLDASNNYAERCMRTVAVGRKAFLFVGSERAGRPAAIYYSFVESCKANKVNPLTYLTYVLANARNKLNTLPTPDEFTASNIAHVG